MMKRTISALLTASALLCAAALPALASEPSTPQADSAQTQEAAMPDSVSYYGQIQGIGRDESGAITSLWLTSERCGESIMNISEQTVWIDSGNYSASDPSDLETGEWVYVYHSPVSTRSLPPQSAAYAVVRSIPQDVGAAQYQEVEAVTWNEDGGLTITTDNGGLLISLDENTQIHTYSGGEASLEDIRVGSHVMSWHQIVLTSYPGQTGTRHLMLLLDVQEETESTPTRAELPPDGTELSIVLEGDMVLPVTGKVENGTAMLPVAAAAQSLGYEVTYTPGQGGGTDLVTVESDSFRVSLRIGEPAIYGVTKIEGAVGMTAPMDYGMAPYIVEPGVTWAPARLFELLGRTVTVEGDILYLS